MSSSRCFVVSLLVFCLLLLAIPLFAEYDILTRYDVTRPEGGRHFWLYSPTRYQLANSTEQRPLPLILFFHGYSDQCELQVLTPHPPRTAPSTCCSIQHFTHSISCECCVLCCSPPCAGLHIAILYLGVRCGSASVPHRSHVRHQSGPRLELGLPS